MDIDEEIDFDQWEDEPDQSLTSTDERWAAYKRQCREQAVDPMDWGSWLRAGQPLQIHVLGGKG